MAQAGRPAYDAALFALFKWAETRHNTNAAVPVFSLDLDLGNLLADALEANPELKAAYTTAFRRLNTDLETVLSFEKANTTAKKAQIGVFGVNKVAERFFAEEETMFPAPSGYALVSPPSEAQASWAPAGEE